MPTSLCFASQSEVTAPMVQVMCTIGSAVLLVAALVPSVGSIIGVRKHSQATTCHSTLTLILVGTMLPTHDSCCACDSGAISWIRGHQAHRYVLAPTIHHRMHGNST